MSVVRMIDVPVKISGVYLLGQSQKRSYYIGQSRDLVGRLLDHKHTWQPLGVDIRMMLLMEVDGSNAYAERIQHERRFMASAMHLGIPIWNSEQSLPYHEEIKKEDLSVEIAHLKYAVEILGPSEPLPPTKTKYARRSELSRAE
jgi:hypothetical protein